jgi:hypothetical protein
MILRFCSGSVTPASASRNRSAASATCRGRAGGGDEVLLDLLALPGPHQPVVDEHAGQPVTDGALDERGGDGGVDPAGQPADRAAVADLGTDRLDGLVDDRRRRPGRADARDVVQEPAQHLLAVRRVPDLGVVLHAGQTPVGVLERGDRDPVGRRGDGESRGGGGHRVAVGSSTPGACGAGPRAACRGYRSARPRCGRTRGCRRGRPRRPAPGPSPGSRNTCRTPGCRPRTAPGRPRGRRRRTRSRGRRRGSPRRARGPRSRRRAGTRARSRSRRPPRARDGR